MKKDGKTEDKNELNNELNNYNNLARPPRHLKYEKGPYVSCEYNTISNIISKSFGVIKDITTILYHWYGNTEIYIIHHKQFSHFRDKNSFKNIIFINNDIPDEELERVTNNLKERDIVLESLDNWIEKMYPFIPAEKYDGNKFIENDVKNLFKKRKDINKYFYECGCVLESISTNANNNGGYKRRKKLKRRKKTKKKLKRRKKTKKKDKKRKNKKRKQKKTKHKKKRKRKTKRV